MKPTHNPLSPQQINVLRFLAVDPPGADPDYIMAALGLSRSRCSQRMSSLLNRGLIRWVETPFGPARAYLTKEGKTALLEVTKCEN